MLITAQTIERADRIGADLVDERLIDLEHASIGNCRR